MKIFKKIEDENRVQIQLFGKNIFYRREDELEIYTRFLCFRRYIAKETHNAELQAPKPTLKAPKINKREKRERKVALSVVVPVHNAAPYLEACLQSLRAQEGISFEVLLVNDASTDNSAEICNETVAKDDRFKLIDIKKNVGVAAARNLGISIAIGEYIGFVDPDDVIGKEYFRAMYNRAIESNSEIVVNYRIERIDPSDKIIGRKFAGINKERAGLTFRDKIRIASSTGITWNKIYKREFLQENNIYFPEIKTMGTDNYFTWLSLAMAGKVSSLKGDSYFYRENPHSIIRKEKDASYFKLADVYERLLLRMNNIKYKNRKEKQIWLRSLYSRIARDTKSNISGFNNDELKQQCLAYSKDIFPFLNVEIKEKLPIISLTSYPGRINTVHEVIQSLKRQKHPYQKIILWLAEGQFSKKESELPKALLDLVDAKFQICWCKEDIRSYKKLIPALINYPEEIIVTCDDDIIYPEDWLSRLMESYYENPDVIHCLRGRSIEIDEAKKGFKPYSTWRLIDTPIFETKRILLTGAGGCLYKKSLLMDDVLDVDKFTNLCPDADDVWFWSSAIRKGTKIKVARNPLNKLNEIEGSQESSLWSENIIKNDLVLNKLVQAYPGIIHDLLLEA